jgi:1-acyl-sn-glycerol-3-phosphate acyltransferase
VATYIVLSKTSPEGRKRLHQDPDRITSLDAELKAVDGRVIHQFATLGQYDFAAVVSAPDNLMAQRMAVDAMSQGQQRLMVLPAIDLDLFVRLMGQSTETVGPYNWQISWWAQAVRAGMRRSTVDSHVKEACKPFTVQGRENLKGAKGPFIVIANHSSHLDSIVLLKSLPFRLSHRLAFGGAADRWFLKDMKGKKSGWYNSLVMNTWPIKRGGGTSSLDYGKWLLDKGWSLMIFPEGTRSTTGKMAKFRHGVSVLALEKNVPVLPVYMEGLREIRPKGTKEITPGPVTVNIGRPIHFAPDTQVPDATYRMYKAMEALRDEVHVRRSGVPAGAAVEAQPEALPEAGSPAG